MQLRTLILPSFFAFTFALPNPCAPGPQKTGEAPPEKEAPVEVAIIYPRFEDVPRTVSGTGFFGASEKLTVKAEVAAIVDKIYVGEGDRIAVDDPLCLFKSEDLAKRIELKKTELREAEAALAKQREMGGEGTPGMRMEKGEPVFLDEDTAEPPPAEGDAENADLPPRRRTAPVTSETVEKLEQELTLLEDQFKLLNVNAAIAGIVQKKYVSEGSLVERGDPLFDIVNLDPISLSFNVPQDVSTYVDKQLKVRASPLAAPEMALEGAVFFINPSVDPIKRTLEIRAHLPNPDGLIKDGQEGRATILTRKVDRVLVIPKKAVVSNEEKNFIYVVEGNRAVKTEVRVMGEVRTQEVGIDANLRVDDPIVVSGVEHLTKEAQPVTVAREAPALTPLP